MVASRRRKGKAASAHAAHAPTRPGPPRVTSRRCSAASCTSAARGGCSGHRCASVLLLDVIAGPFRKSSSRRISSSAAAPFGEADNMFAAAHRTRSGAAKAAALSNAGVVAKQPEFHGQTRAGSFTCGWLAWRVEHAHVCRVCRSVSRLLAFGSRAWVRSGVIPKGLKRLKNGRTIHAHAGHASCSAS